MGTYTLELREVLEYTGATLETVGSRTIVRNSGIGLETYPIFDETYRDKLNGLIVDRFYTREIAHETIDIFRLRFRAHMNENMTFFNQLYESTRMKFDPFKTVDIETVSENSSQAEQETQGNATTGNNAESSSRNVASDTPQSRMNRSEDYASSMADANSKTSAESTSRDTGEMMSTARQESSSRQSGYSALPTDLLEAYRNSLLQVDMMVLDSLDTLFMQLWGNNDSIQIKDLQW